LTKTKSHVLAILNRLISWFFLFVILFSMLGMVLILSGFPEIYHFISSPAMLLASGLFSCLFTFHFTIKELEKERNEEPEVA